MTVKAPTNIILPVPTSSMEREQIIDYLSRLNVALQREMSRFMHPDETVSYIHLRSPAGHVFRVEVSDAGVLTTTQVYQA